MKCLHTYILDDIGMFENTMDDVRRRIQKIFTDRDFSKAVENSGKDLTSRFSIFRGWE